MAAIWLAERRRRPKIFNGVIFSADTITPTLITGRWSHYRCLVAQMRAPDLFDALAIRAVAVSGLLHGPGGVLLGQRESGAIYHAGLWQLPPAGSLDGATARPDGSVDFRSQLLVEAEEELGLSADVIGEALPICAVEHPGSHVLDIGLSADVTLSPAELLACHARSRDAEYQRIVLVPPDRLAAYVAGLGDRVVPSVPVFVRHWLAASLSQLSLGSA